MSMALRANACHGPSEPNALFQKLVRLEFIEFIASFAFVELGEFMGPSKDPLALFLVLAEGLMFCGSCGPRRR